MTEQELDEIMTFRWPQVVRTTMASSADKRTKGFVLGIAKYGKRRDWFPSPKQAALMRRILREQNDGTNDEFEVIER